MKKVTLREVVKATGGSLIQGSENIEIDGVSIDTRQARESDLFFAFVGEKSDGHEFLPQLFEKGCKASVVSNETLAKKAIEQYNDAGIILVEDTMAALQSLAKWYMTTLNVKRVAVTGSSGKTSTKDMLYYILSEKYRTVCSQGNFNNEIGMPLTALSVDDRETDIVIFEMGMSDLGEIHTLADIGKPQVAIITNVGITHLERLGSRENILRAKLEITDFLREEDTLVINDGGDMLTAANAAGRYKLVTTGTDGRSNYIISDIRELGGEGISFVLENRQKTVLVKLPVPGRHNVINASLAIAAAAQLGVTMEEAAEGLKKLVLTGKRLDIKGKGGIKVIDDTYNASPDSMKAGIDVLMSTTGVRKVAILGDMFELGDQAEEYHRQVGEYAAQNGVDLFIAIGNSAEYMAEGASSLMPQERVLHYKGKKEFFKVIDTVISVGDVVLIKGSRGMKMEEITAKILE